VVVLSQVLSDEVGTLVMRPGLNVGNFGLLHRVYALCDGVHWSGVV